jgi:hypothetical protein
MDEADGFDDLDALRLSPEQVATTKPLRKRRQAKAHVAGGFYLCSLEWADRAGAELGSAAQLLVALRLYRRWRLRKPQEDTIVASNEVLAGIREFGLNLTGRGGANETHEKGG